MTHGEFVAAYARGELRVEIEPRSAARHLSSRLLLPFVTMPVLGIGIALALVGWIFSGLTIVALGIVVPHFIKRSAPHFLLTQALDDAAVYEDLTRSGVLRATPVSSIPSPPA
ncbi:MAG TPA: hypothetical protein VLC73_15485 [Burkholderiales bacterium]|nr:hypothetical protein [Burkholderiales bacterium]